ncbi:hypothetical protein OPV22_006214 [Ensete ventricosum]|uniref:Uncharacterized protein n=1 Tax=Ensete ventricosum TaxID=4639 RepID=A0AAV8RP84_ENSVE|nr:hypothetical protein OPV22_006214 [Ensete ventricosum]
MVSSVKQARQLSLSPLWVGDRFLFSGVDGFGILRWDGSLRLRLYSLLLPGVDEPCYCQYDFSGSWPIRKIFNSNIVTIVYFSLVTHDALGYFGQIGLDFECLRLVQDLSVLFMVLPLSWF